MANPNINYIDFAKLSGFTLEAVLESINNCLKIAGRHGGIVFGGFVRDVIIPRRQDPRCNVHFKDVDVWFKTQQSADTFIAEMGCSFKQMSSFDVPQSGNRMYRFGRRQYHLSQHNTCIAFIDVIVNETIPVNDFNVNCLGCHYFGGSIDFHSFCDETVDDLVTGILTKNIIMLTSYISVINNDEYVHVRRVRCRYLDRGWTIRLHGGPEMLPKEFNRTWFDRVISTRENIGKTSSQTEQSSVRTMAQNKSSSSTKINPNMVVTVGTGNQNMCIPINNNGASSKDQELNKDRESNKNEESNKDRESNKNKESSVNIKREEALAAFNMGVEALRIAFLKVLDMKS
ncbi:Hypothetical protein HVR_LOCUS465 [uncultured virus]|nr:Hypothetical protein HVR_LOCUS465 [uncultured virus]